LVGNLKEGPYHYLQSPAPFVAMFCSPSGRDTLVVSTGSYNCNNNAAINR